MDEVNPVQARLGAIAKELAYTLAGAFVPTIRRNVNGEVVRFPLRVARYYGSTYEPEKADFLRSSCKPGTVAVDAGAHIGLFTVAMARSIGPKGRVIAVEPTAATARILLATLRASDVEADVVVAALGDHDGEAVLADTGTPASCQNTLAQDGIRESSIVPMRTIDSLVAADSRPVSCIKIDVEGAELLVLKGAGQTIREHRPAITIEVHPRLLETLGGSAAEVYDLVRSYGYTLRCSDVVIDRADFINRRDFFEVQAIFTGSGAPSGAAGEK